MHTRIRKRTVGVLILVASIGVHAQDREGVQGEDFGRFAVSELTAVIGNNNGMTPHRPWYNGLFSMTSPHQASSPYVPRYAGVNLENIYDGRNRHPDRAVFFEPRSQPMTFERVSDTVVLLRQEATPFYGIESNMRFELREPYYVDYTYRCVPHKADLAGGFFGVFWASYIDAPLDKSFHFLGAGSTLEAPVWEEFHTQEHDRDSTLIHEQDNLDLAFEPGSSALWRSISPLRYGVPFFYGRYRNMVLIYIFQTEEILRFAHSPSGGGRNEAHDQKNPAWDFHMVVPDYTVGQSYGLALRVVYKPWVDRADVLNEVKKYLHPTA